MEATPHAQRGPTQSRNIVASIRQHQALGQSWCAAEYGIVVDSTLWQLVQALLAREAA